MALESVRWRNHWCHATGRMLVQEKQKQLEEINQKVDGMHMVEQWQLVQASYHKVIAWQQVGWLYAPAHNTILASIQALL